MTNKTGFTKGEWAIDNTYSTMYLMTSVNGHICEVDCDYDCDGNASPTDEQKANAHLIAAAPEMCRVIEQIVKWQDGDKGELLEYINNSKSSFKKLLAKARGGS